MSARIAWGTQFLADTGTAGAFVSVGGPGEIKSYTMPESAVADVDITGIDQTSAVKQTVPGLVEGGQCELEYYHVPGTYSKVNALLLAGGTVQNNWKLIVGAVTYSWLGYVQKVGGITGGGPSDPLMYKFSVKINSLVTIGTNP